MPKTYGTLNEEDAMVFGNFGFVPVGAGAEGWFGGDYGDDPVFREKIERWVAYCLEVDCRGFGDIEPMPTWEESEVIRKEKKRRASEEVVRITEEVDLIDLSSEVGA